MSVLQHRDRGQHLVSSQVLEKVRSQFPEWAAATLSRGDTVAENDGYSEFHLASNWMLRSEALAEMTNGLEKSMEGVQISYDSELSLLRIRCLTSKEGAVMAKCQSLMDEIVQRELKGGLDTSKHIITPQKWHDEAEDIRQSEKMKSMMALAPSDIRGSVYQTLWIMPEILVKKGVVMPKLVPSQAFAKLQHLTGCRMKISGDGLYMYIGAESEDKISVAERKLNTLAKYASIPSKADIRCESFIYAEDQQRGLAKFTYMVHGAKPILKTFFLDRMFYRLTEEDSAYGKLFEKGVVVTLSDNSKKQALKGMGVTPVTPSKDRNGAYLAFSSEWTYTAKQASSDIASSASFDPNPRVTSWITKLPTPELMLPHGDGKDTPDPDSGISDGYSKEINSYNGERTLTQKEVYEQKSKLLPQHIGKVIPTLPKPTEEDSAPAAVIEAIGEQHVRSSHQVDQGFDQGKSTFPGENREPEGGMMPQSPQEDTAGQQRSRGGRGTTGGGRKGQPGQRRGDGRQSSQQETGRGRGNRGNRSNRGDRANRGTRGNRGNRGNRGGKRPSQNPPSGRQRPTEQSRTNSNRAANRVVDQTPSHFSHFSQHNSQIQSETRENIEPLNTKDTGSTAYVPPHLRYLITGSKTGSTKQVSQGTPAAREGGLINLDFDESEQERVSNELQSNISEIAEETKPQNDDMQSSTQHTPIRADPFADTWDMHRLQHRLPTIKTDNHNHGDRAQVLHSTMKQQAGAPTTQKRVSSRGKILVPEDPDPQLIEAMSQKIVGMMTSLEVFPGKVTLKAEIGRFCLTKINQSYVQAQGEGESLQDIKEALDRHHMNPHDVMFTGILTSEGADANHIAFMEDNSGKRMWTGNNRRTVYEITCCALTKDKKYCRFIIEVDGSDYTFRVNRMVSDSCSLFVHCPKRSWDFKIALSKSQDLGDDFDGYAEDLIRSISVTPQPTGVPILELTAKKAFDVELIALRIRNIASYSKSNTALEMMEICEVHDMGPSNIKEDDNKITVVFEQRPVYQQLGQLGTWYEVSIQSKPVMEALQQNRDLELGEEVDWSPEKLREAGAFDQLIRSTIEVVKNIDGVGYWEDNYQDTMIHGMPVTGSTTYSQRSGTMMSRASIW